MKNRVGDASRVAVTVVALFLPTAPATVAQAPSLDRVEELARFGRPEEARDLLMAWWTESSDGASQRDQQRGLWLRARLTVDPEQAALDYRRLVVLYPRGEYTAQALLRLAQAAHEMGDEETARAHVQALANDFRDAPVRREAEAWLREAGPAPAPPEPGAAALEPARRLAARAPSADAVSRPDPGAREPEGEIGRAGFYYVQLGAFAEEARAMAVFERAVAEGVPARVVRVEGSQFLHVRVGRFQRRDDAAAEVERVAELGIIAALVRDDREERIVRN